MHAWLRLFMVLAAAALAVAACADPNSSRRLGTPAYSATSTAMPRATPSLLPADAPPPAETMTPLVVAADLDPHLAVLFDREGEIWSLDTRSGKTKLVARGLQAAGPYEAGDPWALAPNGKFLALARNAMGQPAALSLVAFPGGKVQEMGRFAGRIEGLRWSHDASRLAFLVNQRDDMTGDLLSQSLELYDTASGRQVTLYQQSFQPEETYRQGLWLEAWAPGDTALYVVYVLEQTDDPGILYALDVRGGEPRLVSEEYLLKGGQAVCRLTSQVLLRWTVPYTEGGVKVSPIYVAKAGPNGDLTGIRQLSPADWLVGSVAWAPDGQRVVVERLEAQEHGTFAVHLWLLSLNGDAPRQLTTDEGYREEWPAWTPDGAEIIFGRWRAVQPEPAGLWAMGLEGEPRQLDEAGTRPQAAGQPSLATGG